MKITLILFIMGLYFVTTHRITTIQLDGIQYFISRMNPYSQKLNYFLAYQYCRSLGLQLVSFETKEKADIMIEYLRNAGYAKYDFWTSGNKLGTNMFLWMSTGLPFNATFNYMTKLKGNRPINLPSSTVPQRVARESRSSGSPENCVAMTVPSLTWNTLDCMLIKDFICEQTRCYYYNYGGIPVSETKGNQRPFINNRMTDMMTKTLSSIIRGTKKASTATQYQNLNYRKYLDNRYQESAKNFFNVEYLHQCRNHKNIILNRLVTSNLEKGSRPTDFLDITSLFINRNISQDNIFENLDTRNIRSSFPTTTSASRELFQSELEQETEVTNNAFTESHTIGPYASIDDDYQSDQAGLLLSQKKFVNNTDDDTSTVLPEDEPSYKYNIKIRSNGKVLHSSTN